MSNNNRNVLAKTDTMSYRISKEVKNLRRKHLDDLSNARIAPAISVAWLASLNAYSRVKDHARNIAESVAGE